MAPLFLWLMGDNMCRSASRSDYTPMRFSPCSSPMRKWSRKSFVWWCRWPQPVSKGLRGCLEIGDFVDERPKSCSANPGLCRNLLMFCAAKHVIACTPVQFPNTLLAELCGQILSNANIIRGWLRITATIFLYVLTESNEYKRLITNWIGQCLNKASQNQQSTLLSLGHNVCSL